MPAQALRLDGYVRVSRVRRRSGPSFISPQVQRERIEAWCSLYDARLMRVFEELDESGARADRPKLLQAIGRVEAGLSDGIIVAKLDRFGRSLRDALDHIDRIQSAGGTFVSVQDNFDLSTDHGRLMLRMMLAFAEFERDRIRANWEDAQAHAIARGVHGSPIAPVGYRRRPDGRLKLDPRYAPIIREAFERRARGATLGEMGAFLRERGVRSARGGRVWRRCTMLCLFANRVYLGQASFGDFVNPDAHKPLIDPITWRLAQHQPVKRMRPQQPGLLYGVLRCASCRALMTIHSDRPDRLYRCSRKPSQLGACPKKAYITATSIDALAEDLLFAVARRRPQLVRKAQSALVAAATDVERAEAALVRYRDNQRLIEVMTPEQYAAGVQARALAVSDAVDELAVRRADSADLDLLKLRGIQKRWPDLPLAEKQEALRIAYDALFIRPGHKHLEERLWICERGEAPAHLPRPYKPRPPRPFDFPTASGKTTRQERRLMAAERFGWSDEEIERRLRTFTAARSTFPTPGEFFSAGERRLYEHIMLRGGGPVWAARVERRFPQGKRRESLLWTEERVRDELETYLSGRTRWPLMEEFRAAGKEGLRRALVRFGGMQHWAAEFDLPMQNFRGPHLTWTEEKIEQAIRELVGDREEWPRRREFSRAGLDGCYAAMWRTGGTEVWVERIGIRLPESRGGRRVKRVASSSAR
jgi:DNA invertase Pin-like site-specific DNA recombinase